MKKCKKCGKELTQVFNAVNTMTKKGWVYYCEECFNKKYKRST